VREKGKKGGKKTLKTYGFEHFKQLSDKNAAKRKKAVDNS